MSNIGLFSTSTLIATDLSLNGIINITTNNLFPKYKQTQTIDGILQISTIHQNNPMSAYFSGGVYVKTLTTYAGFNFSNTAHSDFGLHLFLISKLFPMYETNGTWMIPYTGFYLISGQFSFASNTANNIYTLNHYDINGSQITDDTIIVCQEPTSNSTPSIRAFKHLLYFNAGERFSITLSTFVGPDVLIYGESFKYSNIQIYSLT